jgi:Mrp family chromosome partitioning ATPase
MGNPEMPGRRRQGLLQLHKEFQPNGEVRMGKTFEALKKAERERSEMFLQPVPQIEKSIQPYSLLEGIPGVSPPWCQELWHKLRQQSQNGELKKLLFTGLSQGSGCTSTVAVFGIYLAISLQKKVLAMDLNLVKPGLKLFFRPGDTSETAEVLTQSSIQQSDFFQTLRRNLTVVINDGEPMRDGVAWLESPFFDQFVEKARSEFDFILFDTGQAANSTETRLLCPRADAVIIVIKAGEVRGSVASRVKMDLEASGAKIAGVVLNKRKYYIPNWLYKRL